VAAPFAVIGLLLSGSLPDHKSEADGFDWKSAAAYAVLISLLFASLESSLWSASHWWMRMACLALSIAPGVWLVRRANKVERPLLPIDLLRRPLIAFSLCGALCAFASSMAVMLVLPFRMNALHGFDPIEIGLALSAWPIATMFAAPAAGVLSDRFPAWMIGTIGLLGAVVSMALLAAAPADASVFDISWRLCLLGVCFPAYTASNMRLVVANSPHSRAASAGSITSTTRILGQSLGAVFASWIIAENLVVQAQGLLVPGALAMCGVTLSIIRRNAT
jgi:DHA2 family multidrug resistance protein-like MFS transporter